MKLVSKFSKVATLLMGFLLMAAPFGKAFSFEYVSTISGTERVTQQLSVTTGGDFTLTFTDFNFVSPLQSGGAILTSSTEEFARINYFQDGIATTSIPGLSYTSESSLFSSSSSVTLSSGGSASSPSTQSGPFQQSVSGTLDAGIYYLTFFASTESGSGYSFGPNFGLYGIDLSGVSASPVPIPASVALMASGLALFGYVGRKRKGSSKALSA